MASKPLPDNEFEGARRILWRYFDDIMQQLVEEIIQHKEEFEKGTFGNADEIIEKHHIRIMRLSAIYANLKKYASKEKPQHGQVLDEGEFRCFNCGAIIKRQDERCR